MELKIHDCYMENDSHFGNTPESEDFFFSSLHKVDRI